MKLRSRTVSTTFVLALATTGAALGGELTQATSTAALFATGGTFGLQPVLVSARRLPTNLAFVATAAEGDRPATGSDLAIHLAASEPQRPAGAAYTNQPTLTLDGAKRVAAAALAYAHSHDAPGGSVAVVDAGGHTLYLERLDGTFPASSDVSIGKARTAVNFGKPTRGLEDAINKGRPALLPVAGVTWFTPLQGGVPIVVDGHVIGGVGVSGALSQQQDEEVAIAGAQAIEGAPATSQREKQ